MNEKDPKETEEEKQEDKQEKKEEARRKTLEKVMKEKVAPLVDKEMHEYLGITINELKEDLTAKLKKPFVDYVVSIAIPFKQAKHIFKREYLRKLLLLNFGNISEVARIAGINRRSIHRLIKEVGIDVDKIRRDMIKEYDIKKETVTNIIERVLDDYKETIHPAKLQKMYAHVDTFSEKIVDMLPETPMTLKEAEEDFERAYLSQALKENGNNMSKTAKKIGLRYETLHRKVKSLGIKGTKE